MAKKAKDNNRLLSVLSWGVVLFWMAVLFWFSSQPAQESVKWSVGAMEIGWRLLNYWQWIGVIGFVIVYHIFLLWLSRISSGRLIKIGLFILFILLSLTSVYLLVYVIRPRVGESGILEMNRWVIHRYLRKYAHFFIYLFLGSVIKNALWVSGIEGWKAVGLAIFLSFLYAVFDEIHQIFVPGRMFLVTDILIDTAGAAVGVTIYSLFNFLFQLTKKDRKTGSAR